HRRTVRAGAREAAARLPVVPGRAPALGRHHARADRRGTPAVSVVVDASVALDWVFRSERSQGANRVLEHVLREGMLVPPIWPAEVANGLLNARRRGRLAAGDLPPPLALFDGFPVGVASHAALASIRSL